MGDWLRRAVGGQPLIISRFLLPCNGNHPSCLLCGTPSACCFGWGLPWGCATGATPGWYVVPIQGTPPLRGRLQGHVTLRAASPQHSRETGVLGAAERTGNRCLSTMSTLSIGDRLRHRHTVHLTICMLPFCPSKTACLRAGKFTAQLGNGRLASQFAGTRRANG
jgi:hypothetical protein